MKKYIIFLMVFLIAMPLIFGMIDLTQPGLMTNNFNPSGELRETLKAESVQEKILANYQNRSIINQIKEEGQHPDQYFIFESEFTILAFAIVANKFDLADALIKQGADPLAYGKRSAAVRSAMHNVAGLEYVFSKLNSPHIKIDGEPLKDLLIEHSSGTRDYIINYYDFLDDKLYVTKHTIQHAGVKVRDNKIWVMSRLGKPVTIQTAEDYYKDKEPEYIKIMKPFVGEVHTYNVNDDKLTLYFIDDLVTRIHVTKKISRLEDVPIESAGIE